MLFFIRPHYVFLITINTLIAFLMTWQIGFEVVYFSKFYGGILSGNNKI